jgi:Xaa-Pro dipeptidase
MIAATGDKGDDIGALVEPFGERCRRAAALAHGSGAAALLAADPATVRWLTGRSAEVEVGPPYPIWAGTYVVLRPDGSGRIVCAAGDEAGGPAIDGLEVVAYEAYSVGSLRAYANAARLVGDGLGLARRTAVEPDATALSILGDRGWIDVAGALRALRMVKDAAEIAAIERSCRVVSAGQRAFRATARPGMREIELFSAIHAAMEAACGRRVPVLPDLMSGDRMMEVGAPPTDRVMQAGELALCDLAARHEGTWADSCTTICLGTPTASMRRVHDTVRRVLDQAISMARPGVVAADLDRAVRDAITSAGYDFPHHTGHGVGAGYHEEPRIIPGATAVLEENMVVALEPAAFADGVGARVEHIVVVTSGGGRILTDYETRLEQ